MASIEKLFTLKVKDIMITNLNPVGMSPLWSIAQVFGVFKFRHISHTSPNRPGSSRRPQPAPNPLKPTPPIPPGQFP